MPVRRSPILPPLIHLETGGRRNLLLWLPGPLPKDPGPKQEKRSAPTNLPTGEPRLHARGTGPARTTPTGAGAGLRGCDEGTSSDERQKPPAETHTNDTLGI
jgi:hypothetical protein